MNLLMIAPLLDSRGVIRYFIGAQVDVSGLVKDCTDLEGLQLLLEKQEQEQSAEQGVPAEELDDKKDEFKQLSEMLNVSELDTVRKVGGRMHREQLDSSDDLHQGSRPRILVKEPGNPYQAPLKGVGKLDGIYQHYLLVRPYPSLRILFVSPSLRVPGILQSPLLSRIGGSQRVHKDLIAALAEGRGVTAKVRWVSGKAGDEEGRARWMHCTPLLGHTGAVGVWMIVIVDDDVASPSRRFRMAPPVAHDLAALRGLGRGPSSVRSDIGSYSRPNPPISFQKRSTTPSGGSRRRPTTDTERDIPLPGHYAQPGPFIPHVSRPNTRHEFQEQLLAQERESNGSLHSFALG